MIQKEKRLDYLQAIVDSQISPLEVLMLREQTPEQFFHADVRIAPSKMKGQKVSGSLEVPLNELASHLEELPKDKTILVCTWGPTCSLAKSASILLLQSDFEVKELSGGIALWEEFGFPPNQVATCK